MKCQDIGIKVGREEFATFLDSVKGGQFFIVKGYENTEGEVSDHILRFGINYASLKDRDIQTLEQIRDGKPSKAIDVVHGSWIPDELLQGESQSIFLELSDIATLNSEDRSNIVMVKISYDVTSGKSSIRVNKTGAVNLMDVTHFTNRKANGKTACTVSYSLNSTHPLVIAAIGGSDLQKTLLQGLVNPVQHGVGYEKQAKSAFSLNKEGKTVWYIRDVLSVYKKVRVKGQYAFSASLPVNAVKDAVAKAFLLTSKYRQFILTEGQFESITISGQSILCDGMDEEFYFALPEHVKAAVEETSEVFVYQS